MISLSATPRRFFCFLDVRQALVLLCTMSPLLFEACILDPCRPSTEGGIRFALTQAECEMVNIEKTGLNSLAGAEGQTSAAAVFVSNNAILTDVAALRRADHVVLHQNPQLKNVVVHAASVAFEGAVMNAQVWLHDHAPSSEPDEDGDLRSIIGWLQPAPQTLTLRCEDGVACRTDVSIDSEGFQDVEIVIDGPEVINLRMSRTVPTSWEFLKGFGVPTGEVTIGGHVEDEAIVAWHSWLVSQGFGGTMKACADDDCQSMP